MMFLVAKLPLPRGSGSHSPKQWAAGAPVIGAAPVSSGRPKRPRTEGLSGSGALQLFVVPAVSAAGVHKETNRTKGNIGKTMAAKNTLKYKRNETRPLPDLVNELIDKCLGAIASFDFKASIADLIALIRLRLKLMLPDQTPPRVVWID